jgi:hypothetical protein
VVLHHTRWGYWRLFGVALACQHPAQANTLGVLRQQSTRSHFGTRFQRRLKWLIHFIVLIVVANVVGIKNDGVASFHRLASFCFSVPHNERG